MTRSRPRRRRAGSRCLDPLPDPLGELERAVAAGLRQRDDELLAAVARRLVDAARLLREDPADPAQDLVALEVAVGVVDLLEVVDVEHHQRQLVTEALGARRLLRDQLAEAPLVGEPGELVGDRLLGDELVQIDVLDRDRRLADR